MSIPPATPNAATATSSPTTPPVLANSPDKVTLTVDGREVNVPKGTLLVEAAKTIGVQIPVFCYHPRLKPVGACRMCLVEIEKMPRLQTACTTPVADGMVVTTTSRNVVEAQNGVLELLLTNHPLDCPICDKGGECPLQDYTFAYGPGASRFTEEKRHNEKAFVLSERIVLDRERCIMCFRCTRFQSEIAGDEALAAVDRGGYSEIGVLEGETFDSIFSGNTIEICPVGALTSRQYRFRARPWDLQRTPSTCVGCAVGCSAELHARDGQILRMLARQNDEVNDVWLCDTGRFDTLPPLLERRVVTPLARRDGRLEPTSWEVALGRAVELLRSGPTGLVASPSLSNEVTWLFADALRAALPEARAGFWPRAAAPWPLRGQIKHLVGCKTVILVGLDAWCELPILALWIRKAVQNGGTLIAIGPENGLYRDTAHWLRVDAGREAAMVEELLDAVVRDGAGGDAAGRPLDGRAALAGGPVDDGAVGAAARRIGPGPAAVLAGPRVAADRAAQEVLDRLAEAANASGDNGLVGSPALAANGRGALDLAPDLALADVDIGPIGQALRGELRSILFVGRERWPSTGGARRVLMTTGPLDSEDLEYAEVVLPIAHPYEQAGSITNLEGRVQHLHTAGLPPDGVPPDWTLLADLAALLGGNPPRGLPALRAALSETHPSYRLPEGPSRRRGKLSLPVA